MAFQTVIRYATDIGLQGASSVHEDGKPNEICLQGLQSATTYYAMADLLEDGVRVAQSEKANFTTLAAGAMSVTYSSYRRKSCYEHVVVYTYTSTYAPSSCILHTEGQGGFVANYQGLIDSSNNTVTFEIDDWDGGVNYDVYATLYDIYGEEQQSITTTLTSGTINTISLTPTAATETTVTLEIDKCDDCGFYVGWVDYWLSTQDPDTDPSIAHEYFNSADTGITITGLSSDTAYYFRATFVCDDEQTEVTGAAVSATTAHDYSGDYFYLENTYNGTNTFTVKKPNGASARTIQYSFNKTYWTTLAITESTTTVNVTRGSKIYLRSDNGLGNYLGDYISLSMTNSHKAGGHIASLLNYNQMGHYSTVNYYELQYLFYGNTELTDASDIDFTGITTIKTSGCYCMFAGCTSLVVPPPLTATTLGGTAYAYMFDGCTSLAIPPYMAAKELGERCFIYMFRDCASLSYAPSLFFTAIGKHSCRQMFYKCVSLTTGPDLRNVTSVGESGCYEMFAYCDNLSTAYAPDISSWPTDNTFTRWLFHTSATGTVHKPAALSIPTDTTSGVPSGWTTQNY